VNKFSITTQAYIDWLVNPYPRVDYYCQFAGLKVIVLANVE